MSRPASIASASSAGFTSLPRAGLKTATAASTAASTVAGTVAGSVPHPLPDLLLANLRLLDLHAYDDWPDITSNAFSATDTQQSQSQRVRCTEWILYRLFELWDPSGTKDKLMHFFPPLEPLQSLNLRGALFKSLTELKKDGVLGRETVLRKTMLDECKGDKLLEVMVLFSTAVLKRKVESGRPAKAKSVAYAIASAQTLETAQHSLLVPLSVAHTAGLTALLRKRAEKRQSYAQFSSLLDGKKSQLRQRIRATITDELRQSKVVDETQIKRVIEDNWSGPANWSRTLQDGDDESPGDAPLSRPFDQVWSAVSEGSGLPSQSFKPGLLASLESRIAMQKERLEVWKEFHVVLRASSRGDEEDASLRDRASQGPNGGVQFDKHRQHQFIPGRIRNVTRRKDLPRSSRYDIILQELRSQISSASRSRGTEVGRSMSRSGDPRFDNHDFFSPLKLGSQRPGSFKTGSWKTGNGDNTDNVLFQRARPDSFDSRSTGLGKREVPAVKLKEFMMKRPNMRIDTGGYAGPEPIASPTPDEPDYPSFNEVPVRVMGHQKAGAFRRDIPDTPDTPESVQEDAADQIVSAVVNATPSPLKTLTLTERTRASMARFGPPRSDASKLDSGIFLPQSPPTDDENAITMANGALGSQGTLLERTRQSLAAVPEPGLKPRKSIRPSLFPVNQFGVSPEETFNAGSDGLATAGGPTDVGEYSSIFKSRPRVAHSPVPWTADADADLELGARRPADLSLDLDVVPLGNSEESSFTTSPLRRKALMPLT